MEQVVHILDLKCVQFLHSLALLTTDKPLFLCLYVCSNQQEIFKIYKNILQIGAFP